MGGGDQQWPHSALAHWPPVPETGLPRSQDWILYPLESTSDGPEANLKSGAGPGGRSMTNTGEYLELSAMTSLPNWQAT